MIKDPGGKKKAESGLDILTVNNVASIHIQE